MTRTAATLLALAWFCIVGGVAWIYPPAGAIAAGVLLAAAGVLTIDVSPRRGDDS